MTNIVIGAGAVGTYVAQLLSAKDGEVSVVGRGQEISSLPRGASIWICVKSYDLEGALGKVEKQLNSSHNLFLLTNGLGVYATASSIVHGAKIFRLLLNFGLRFSDSGELIRSGEPKAILSAGPSAHEALPEVAELLVSYGFSLELEPDIERAEWRKLMVNLVINTLATLENAENGVVLHSPQINQRARMILAEIREVADAQHISLHSISDEAIFIGIAQHEKNINSSLADLRAGKQSEIYDFLSKFVECARVGGVEIPTVEGVKVELARMPMLAPALKNLT